MGIKQYLQESSFYYGLVHRSQRTCVNIVSIVEWKLSFVVFFCLPAHFSPERLTCSMYFVNTWTLNKKKSLYARLIIDFRDVTKLMWLKNNKKKKREENQFAFVWTICETISINHRFIFRRKWSSSIFLYQTFSNSEWSKKAHTADCRHEHIKLQADHVKRNKVVAKTNFLKSYGDQIFCFRRCELRLIWVTVFGEAKKNSEENISLWNHRLHACFFLLFWKFSVWTLVLIEFFLEIIIELRHFMPKEAKTAFYCDNIDFDEIPI